MVWSLSLCQLRSSSLDTSGTFQILNALRVLPPDGSHTMLISFTPDEGRIFQEVGFHTCAWEIQAHGKIMLIVKYFHYIKYHALTLRIFYTCLRKSTLYSKLGPEKNLLVLIKNYAIFIANIYTFYSCLRTNALCTFLVPEQFLLVQDNI